MQGLKIQNAERKLRFGSLKTSNFRVVLAIKPLVSIFSQQRMCQVPCQRLIYGAAPPWAEAQCCCSGPWGKTIPSKKEKTIESYIMENVPGVFWVYSSEETNHSTRA